jgi:hypothetical protein
MVAENLKPFLLDLNPTELQKVKDYTTALLHDRNSLLTPPKEKVSQVDYITAPENLEKRIALLHLKGSLIGDMVAD